MPASISSIIHTRDTLTRSPAKLHPDIAPRLPAGVDLLLPGTDWIGYGYRPFGQLMDADLATSMCLFDFPKWEPCTFLGRTYSRPLQVSMLLENQAGLTRIDQLEVRDTIKRIYDQFCAGADWGLFGGEINTAYGRVISNHWEFRSSVLQMYMRLLRLTLTGHMRGFLKPEIRQAIDEAAAQAATKPLATDFFDTFFKTYGTHYISGIHVGGQYNLYMLFNKRSYSKTEQIDLKISALYAGISASNHAQITTTMTELSQRDEIVITAYGALGLPTSWSELAMQRWQEAVRNNPGPTTFYGDAIQGLTPTYTLAATPAAEHALRRAWDAYCERNKSIKLPGIGTALVDVQIGSDEHESHAKDKTKAGGYTLVSGDLNKDAGGYFIYLGKLLADVASREPVVDLKAVVADSSSVGPPAGYTKIPHDLNKDAGGKFIYLCWTKQTAGRELMLPIRDVTVEIYADAKNGAFFTSRGLEAVTDPQGRIVDCNKDAGGKFIYIVMRR